MECRRRLSRCKPAECWNPVLLPSLPNRNQYLVAQVMNFCAESIFFSFILDEHLISHRARSNLNFPFCKSAHMKKLPSWIARDDCNCIVIASTFSFPSSICALIGERKKCSNTKKSYDNVIRFSTECHDKLNRGKKSS